MNFLKSHFSAIVYAFAFVLYIAGLILFIMTRDTDVLIPTLGGGTLLLCVASFYGPKVEGREDDHK